MSRMGVTTVEGKSGYGLDRDTELKQLSVMQVINECPDRKVDIATTFLGAHALPEEYKGRSDAYIDFLINEMLPMIIRNNWPKIAIFSVKKGYSL